jgi:tetratricopeptide (TPR) repeat protein
MGDTYYQRNFGALLEHLGRPREALEEYLKVLEIVPDDGSKESKELAQKVYPTLRKITGQYDFREVTVK